MWSLERRAARGRCSLLSILRGGADCGRMVPERVCCPRLDCFLTTATLIALTLCTWATVRTTWRAVQGVAPCSQQRQTAASCFGVASRSCQSSRRSCREWLPTWRSLGGHTCETRGLSARSARHNCQGQGPLLCTFGRAPLADVSRPVLNHNGQLSPVLLWLLWIWLPGELPSCILSWTRQCLRCNHTV